MDKFLEVTCAFVIVGLALAFGGVQPLAYLLAEVVLLAGVLLLLIHQARQGRIHLPLPLWPVLFVAWAVLALVPLPSRLVAFLSPARLATLSLDASASGVGGWTTLSISPHLTLVALFKFLAYLIAFLLAAYLFDSRKRKSILLGVLIVLGCFEAGYGIVQYLTGWRKIFFSTNVLDLYDATGTYVNRNHFAGLLELVMPFVLASAFYSFQGRSGSPHAEGTRPSSHGSSANFQALFYLFLLAFMGVSLVFSRSRGGIMAAASALVFVALLGNVKAVRKGWTLLVVLFLTIIVGYGLWIGLDPVLARFEEMGEKNFLQLEGRMAIWKDTLSLVREYPVTGTGLGTFGPALRRYQTHLVNNYVDHAHDDYLEFVSETGLPGFVLLFLPILCLVIRVIVSFLNDSHRYRRSILLGCLGSILALLIHSFTDFNLQMPANALIFAIVLGIAYKAACLEPRANANR